MVKPVPMQYEYLPEPQLSSAVIADLFWHHIGGSQRRHEGAENNQYRDALVHFQGSAGRSFDVYASAWEKQPEAMRIKIRPPSYPISGSWIFELAFGRNSFSAGIVSPAKAEFIPEGIENMLSRVIPPVFRKKVAQ